MLLLASLLAPCALAADLDTLTDQLAPRVEALHGLSFLEPPAHQTMTAEALRAWLQSRLDEEAAEFPMAEAMYRALGLLGPGRTLRPLVEEIMVAQVAGLYDPRDKLLYLVDAPTDSAADVRQVFLAHEIAHALDDQHFGLGALLELKGASDALMARQAVIEGSATLLMTRYVARAMQQHWMEPRALLAYVKEEEARGGSLAAYPPILPTTLVAPYIAGFGFLAWGHGVMELGLEVPWFQTRLRSAMTNPPRSMEQVMHPERYWETLDEPVIFGDWSLDGPVRHQDTLGEMVIAQVLEPTRQIGLTAMSGGIPRGERLSNRGATGWDGDRLYLLEGDRAVWLTAWDSPKDRKEFLRALRAALPEARTRTVGDRLAIVGLGLSPVDWDAVPQPPEATEGGVAWVP